MTSGITVAELPIGQVLRNENQPRKSFQGIEELASSIAANGLLQPITVRPIGPERYELVAGERRFRAMTLLKWETVPAIIRPVADEDVFELSVLENVARQEMNPIEEAQALHAYLSYVDQCQAQTRKAMMASLGSGIFFALLGQEVKVAFAPSSRVFQPMLDAARSIPGQFALAAPTPESEEAGTAEPGDPDLDDEEEDDDPE